jgi:hypothetical protein
MDCYGKMVSFFLAGGTCWGLNGKSLQYKRYIIAEAHARDPAGRGSHHFFTNTNISPLILVYGRQSLTIRKLKPLIIKLRVLISTPGPPNILAVSSSGFQRAVSQFNDVSSRK